MFRLITCTMFWLGSAALLFPGHAVWSQEYEDIIVIDPKVGEVIDRQERDTYRLFQSIDGFESAYFTMSPDNSCIIHITYIKDGTRQTQEWKISRQELLQNYQIRIMNYNPDLGIAVYEAKGPVIQIMTESGEKMTGNLQMVNEDTLVLVDVTMLSEGIHTSSGDTVKLNINEIRRLSIPRKSTTGKNTRWALIPAGLGLVLGLAGGDDSAGFMRMTAAQKGMGLAIGIGAPIAFVGGSLGILRGVDIDIPWQDKSPKERRALLGTIRAGHYRPGSTVRFSPWVGFTTMPYEGSRAIFGARLRCHLTPRSGLEFTYGRSAWITHHEHYDHYYQDYSYRWRMDYLSADIFVSTSFGKTINPFLGWGLGRVTRTQERISDSRKYKDHGMSLNFHAGAEFPIRQWLTLEGRLTDIWELGEGHYRSVQLAVTLGADS